MDGVPVKLDSAAIPYVRALLAHWLSYSSPSFPFLLLFLRRPTSGDIPVDEGGVPGAPNNDGLSTLAGVGKSTRMSTDPGL